MKSKTIANIEDSISTVLKTTDESLLLWINEQIQRLEFDVETPSFKALITETIKNPQEEISIAQLDHYIALSKPHLEDRNYFIVGPDDNIVLSSIEMNDTTKAYLEVQILHEAKEWIPSFIPPMDMSIEPDIETPGLFYIAPIRNNGEGHIGYFGIQENPSDQFTRLCQIGRIGETGETYAFNHDGLFLSNSRFDEDLQKIGLIDQEEDSIISIRIRDPQVNLAQTDMEIDYQTNTH